MALNDCRALFSNNSPLATLIFTATAALRDSMRFYVLLPGKAGLPKKININLRLMISGATFCHNFLCNFCALTLQPDPISAQFI